MKHLTNDRELKADVNAIGDRGVTALALAAGKGLRAATELLLNLGANPNSCSWAEEIFSKRLVLYSSVLEMTNKLREKARDCNQNRLYAAITECEKVLVLAGAKKKGQAVRGVQATFARRPTTGKIISNQ